MLPLGSPQGRTTLRFKHDERKRKSYRRRSPCKVRRAACLVVILAVFATLPTDRLVVEIAAMDREWDASGEPASTPALLGHGQEALEDFVREQASATGQADHTSQAPEQLGLDKLINDGS
jgi:hypothetical protein